MEVQGSAEEGRYLSRDRIREQGAATGQVIRGTAFPVGEPRFRPRFRPGNRVSGRGTASAQTGAGVREAVVTRGREGGKDATGLGRGLGRGSLEAWQGLKFLLNVVGSQRTVLSEAGI